MSEDSTRKGEGKLKGVVRTVGSSVELINRHTNEVSLTEVLHP